MSVSDKKRTKETAKKESRSSKKLRRSENGIFIFLKILLLVPFLYSGFFWGLIASINLLSGVEYAADAKKMLIGIGLGAIGIILCFFRAYIIQLAFSAASTICYLSASNGIINRTVQGENDGAIIAEPGEKILSETLEKRHLPYIFFGIIALIIFACRVVPKIIEIREKREEERNAPTESILE